MITFAWRYLHLNAVLAFWLAYILTRPLGASLGDYLSQPKADGGLGLGTNTTTFIFLAAILAVVVYLTITKRDQAPADTLAVEGADLMTSLALSLDPKAILDSLSPYGEIGLMLIIFAETGLLVGFFLPGDSLMFTAGLLASQGSLNLALVLVGCFAAAVIGDQVGFTIGEVVGPRVGRNPNARFIKPAYIERTHTFFDRHGPKTIVLARFVPIVRTFAPVVAGVARMRRSVFLRYNVVGAGLWVVVATMLGYLLADLIGDSIDTYILPDHRCHRARLARAAAARVAEAPAARPRPTTSRSASRTTTTLRRGAPTAPRRRRRT